MIKPACAVFAAVWWAIASPGFAAAPEPRIPYWHLWTDKAGRSQMTMCEVSSFVLQSMNKPAAPVWQHRLPERATVTFSVRPPGWTGTWHEDPHVEFVVPLKGSWFVQGMDGKRVVMGPGTVFLGEDLNTRPDAQGRKGHLSGTVGDAPVTLMIVSLEAKPTIDQPCHVK